MDTCVRCGADLDVGRFCVNCGHRIGAPVPAAEHTPAGGPIVSPPVEDDAGWNPDEDLLPYDDGSGDELSESTLASKVWLGWVVGAVLLVALVFVLLHVFGVDGTGGTADPEATDEATSASPEPPKGVGKARNVARDATFEAASTAPATEDLDGELVSYGADQMHDGIHATAWRMAGDGTGSAITITLAEPTVVKRVGLINGYAKQVSGVDWYPNNRRILAAQWAFEDGTTVEQTFDERPGMQRLKVPPVLTSTVTLTITSVTDPGSGDLGRDYTTISEVLIKGRRAD